MPLEDEVATIRKTSGALPAVGFVLTVADGPARGRSVEIDGDRPARVLVGKSSVCELSLDDPMVSRRHAAFELSGVRLCVTDLGSTNGTVVNGVSVEVAYLSGGESLRIGSTTLRVELRAGSTTASSSSFGRMVGSSARMRAVYSMGAKLATNVVPVIIEGETGTGKELFAECIHEASARAQGPFVVFDASATGAADARNVFAGMFAAAHGGTLFIDEIAELTPETQGALLRAIERGEIVRPGESRWTRMDVRVLAATCRDVEKLVETRNFREDLYFRLAVARVELPPLRRRPGDVAELATHFFQRLGQAETPKEFAERFVGYHWPGNVRELLNAVTRFVALGSQAAARHERMHGSPASASAAGAEQAGQGIIAEVLAANLAFPQARQMVLDEFERAYVERLLSLHQGNVARAAAASGIARRYFQLIRARQAK